MIWQLQEAKNKLSEVVDSSLSKGPQVITRRGQNAAVVMSYEDYKRLVVGKHNLKKTLMSTGFGSLNLSRDKSSTGRATDFNL